MTTKISNDNFYTAVKNPAISDSFVKNNSVNIYQETGELKAKFRDNLGVLYDKSLTSASASPFIKTYSASDLFNSVIDAQIPPATNDNDLIYLPFSNAFSITISLEVPAGYDGGEVEFSYSMYSASAIPTHGMTISSFINRSGFAPITTGGVGTAYPNPLSENIISRQSHSLIAASTIQAGDTISIVFKRLYVNLVPPRLISASVKIVI
jgi:hypothetical protein